MNVPINGNELSDAIGFRGDQLNFKTGRERKRSAFLFSRERLRVRDFGGFRSADELCCGNRYGEYERR